MALTPRAFQSFDCNPSDHPRPVEWIRYFAVVNQLNRARYWFLHSVERLGRTHVPLVLEEFSSFIGLPVFDEETCPVCQDIARIRRVAERAGHAGAELVRAWCLNRCDELKGRAIDAPRSPSPAERRLSRPIIVGAPPGPSDERATHYGFHYAASAIWRFHELMYLSYPPGDVLRSLRSARADGDDPEARGYVTYRWAVYSWALSNWSRVVANVAQQAFVEAAWYEIETSSGLVVALLEKCALQWRDPNIGGLLVRAIGRLADLELARESGYESPPARSELASMLDDGIAAFLFGVPTAELLATRVLSDQDSEASYVDVLDRASMRLESVGPSQIGRAHV